MCVLEVIRNIRYVYVIDRSFQDDVSQIFMASDFSAVPLL